MKILLFGGTGLVGSRFQELLKDEFEIIAPTHLDVDLLNPDEIRKNINETKPDQILYAAGFTNVDKAEEEEELAYNLNSKVPKIITKTAKGTPVIYLSTDYVFDGTKSEAPYKEEDLPNPLSTYAKSKREGEIAVLSEGNENLVLRLIMPYSAVYTKKMDLARIILNKLRNNEKVLGVSDQKINPIFVDHLSFAISKVIKAKTSGIYHLAATSFTTPLEFARLIALEFNLESNLIEQTTLEKFTKSRAAVRPKDSWLDTHKFINQFGNGILHSVEEGIKEFKSQISI